MIMKIDYSDKAVLVIGNKDSSLSVSIAKGFLEHGAKVALTADEKSVAKDLKGQVEFLDAEPDTAESCKKLVDNAVSKLGRLDVLVNCADYRQDKSFESVTPSDFDVGFDKNAKIPLFCTKAAHSHLDKTNGNVINVGSILGLMGELENTATVYSATMGAVIQLTRMTSLWLAPMQIRVNCICTSEIRDSDSQAGNEFEVDEDNYVGPRKIPLGRYAKPGDVVNTALFLGTEYAGFMTGSILVNDGGRYSGN